MLNITDTQEQKAKKLNYIQAPPVSDLLDISYFDEKSNVFFLKDGRMGLMWKIRPIDISLVDAKVAEQISASFNTVLSNFPSGGVGQYIRFSYKDIRHLTTLYENSIENEWREVNKHVDAEDHWKPNIFAKDLQKAIVDLQIQSSQNKDGFFSDLSMDELKKAATIVQEEVNNSSGLDVVSSTDSDDDSVSISLLDNLESEVGEGRIPLIHEHYLVLSWYPEYMFGKFIDNSFDRLLANLNIEDSNTLAAKAMMKHLNQFSKQTQVFRRMLSSTNLVAEQVNGQGLVNLLYRILNPIRSQRVPPPSYSSTFQFHDLLVNKNVRHEIDKVAPFSDIYPQKRGWDIQDGDGRYYMRATSLLDRLEQVRPGILLSLLRGFENEGLICINFDQVSSVVAEARLRLRKKSNDIKQSNPLADKESLKKSNDELVSIGHSLKADVASDRRQLMDVTLSIITGGTDKKRVNEIADGLEGALNNKGLFERYRGDAVTRSSLPFNYSPAQKKGIRRDQPYLSEALADICPLYVNFQGSSDIGIMLNNRSGTPVFIDLWGKSVNTGHSLVVGATGTGKSFTFNYILMSCIAKYSPKIWVIDKGQSYESLCDVMDGNYIWLTLDRITIGTSKLPVDPVCINPFYMPLDKATGIRKLPNREEKSFLREILIAMMTAKIAGENTDTKLDPLVAILLNTAINTYYKNLHETDPSKEATLSDFIKTLKTVNKSDISGKYLAERLEMFYGDGPYAPIFDGQLDMDWENDFTVLETAKMSSDPALPVVLLALFRQIDNYCKSILPEFRKKIIAVDEAWAVLATPLAAKWLAGFYRELRKYNGACFLISQTVKDFIRILQAEASNEGAGQDGILENTSHYFLLPANPADYKLAKEELDFSDKEVQNWSSLASAPPYFGEFFYRMRTKEDKYISGILRLSSPSLLYWISSSKPSDKSMRNKRMKSLIDKGMNKIQARRESILQLANQYPRGA